jgi:hypothetical protein
MKRLATLLTLLSFILASTVVAQEATPTLDPDDHAAHHPEEAAPVSSTVEPEAAPATLDALEQTLGGMAQMDMPADMLAMMGQMQGMMSTMQGMGPEGRMAMMEAMMTMMRGMMAMELPAGMQPMMEHMMQMMGSDMMGGGMMGGPMGMGMGTAAGYSLDALAPLALGYSDGEEVFFVRLEASDGGEIVPDAGMMGTPATTAPSLARIPAELLGAVYVFTNGVESVGPLGFQANVFDSVPGDRDYTPLRSVRLVTWQDGASARELKSAAEVEAAEAAGEITVEVPGVVANMPILVWPGRQR